MSATTAVAAAATAPLSHRRRVLALRVLIVVTVLFVWQIVSVSGWLFRDVVPSLTAIAMALGKLLASPDFYRNLGVTGPIAGARICVVCVRRPASAIARTIPPR